MLSPLENYLALVNAYLEPMPTQRRDDELREIRAHLEQSVAAFEEEGKPGLEAEQSAVDQFGEAEVVAKQLMWAYRHRRANRDQVFWSAASTVLASTILSRIANIVMIVIPLHGPLIANSVYGRALLFESTIAFARAGGISGYAFPKRAVLGAALGTAVLRAPVTVIGQGLLSTIKPELEGLLLIEAIVIAAAWSGSRWRMARTSPVQPA